MAKKINPKERLANTFLILLLSIFILLAGFRTVYNLFKVFTEEVSWIQLSDYEKRKKLFGDIYDFFTVINSKTEKDAEILFLTTDIRMHYLSKYYLYPRRITVVRIDKEQQFDANKYEYIAVFVNNDKSAKVMIGNTNAAKFKDIYIKQTEDTISKLLKK